jgi:hypothetical protein
MLKLTQKQVFEKMTMKQIFDDLQAQRTTIIALQEMLALAKKQLAEYQKQHGTPEELALERLKEVYADNHQDDDFAPEPADIF